MTKIDEHTRRLPRTPSLEAKRTQPITSLFLIIWAFLALPSDFFLLEDEESRGGGICYATAPTISNTAMRFMSCSSSPCGIAAVVGVGPRLGRSIARKFAKKKDTPSPFLLGISARAHATKMSRIADEMAREAKAQVFAIRIDCTDSKSVREDFEGVLWLGFVGVLMYNTCGTAAACFAAVSVESFERYLAVSAVRAFHCAQQVIPGMVESGRGTIIFTGSSASLNGFAGYCRQSCGGLLQCLAREFRSAGIHIAHVVIDGSIGIPCRSSRGDGSTGSMDPDAMEKLHGKVNTSH